MQTPGYGEDEYCREAADIIRGPVRAGRFGRALPDGRHAGQFDRALGGAASVAGRRFHRRGPHRRARDGLHRGLRPQGAVHPPRKRQAARRGGGGACRAHYADASFEHMVQGGAVYVSSPSELGTIYPARSWRRCAMSVTNTGFCSSLTARGWATAWPRGKRRDAALPGGDGGRVLHRRHQAGRALWRGRGHPQRALKRDFRYQIKQRGGMLAKGRLLGIQFAELLRDGLYFDLSRHAVGLAMKLKAALTEMGCEFYIDSPTNQQFPIFPDQQLARLARNTPFPTSAAWIKRARQCASAQAGLRAKRTWTGSSAT